MQFRDYVSTFQEFRKITSGIVMGREIAAARGIDCDDFESVYAAEIAALDNKKLILATERLIAEREWYRVKRPFFNVYPLIERKFRELDIEINMSELVMPFPTIEVRTTTTTVLICQKASSFLFVVEGPSGDYQEFVAAKISTIKAVMDGGFVNFAEPWIARGEFGVSKEEMHNCIFLAVGTCMLAMDDAIVRPVILNTHRREGMTPAEMAAYAAKAIQRTGRIGFEVGKDIERMKATIHYRNGCFARYYVGKHHESYPKNAEASKVPIIKWRCGSVVNKDNTPKVPTGFKDKE